MTFSGDNSNQHGTLQAEKGKFRKARGNQSKALTGEICGHTSVGISSYVIFGMCFLVCIHMNALLKVVTTNCKVLELNERKRK